MAMLESKGSRLSDSNLYTYFPNPSALQSHISRVYQAAMATLIIYNIIT